MYEDKYVQNKLFFIYFYAIQIVQSNSYEIFMPFIRYLQGIRSLKYQTIITSVILNEPRLGLECKIILK